MRALLFWAVCMPVRAAIAVRAVRGEPALRALAAVIGGRWVMRMERGHVGVFGGPVWWAEERPVHGALWSAYAVTGVSHFLVADTVFGAVNWFMKSAGHLTE